MDTKDIKGIDMARVVQQKLNQLAISKHSPVLSKPQSKLPMPKKGEMEQQTIK